MHKQITALLLIGTCLAVAAKGAAPIKSAPAKAAPVTAASAQKLLPAQSSIHFTSTQMGVPVQGRFKRMSGTVQFDAKNLAATRIAIDVPVASATLDSKDADAELPKADWFDAAAFPQASFVLSDAKALGQGEYEVQGSLRIKGQSLPIKSYVLMTRSQGVTWASGSFRISRLAYKIGAGPWADTSVVADPVDVKYKIAISGISAF